MEIYQFTNVLQSKRDQKGKTKPKVRGKEKVIKRNLVKNIQYRKNKIDKQSFNTLLQQIIITIASSLIIFFLNYPTPNDKNIIKEI